MYIEFEFVPSGLVVYTEQMEANLESTKGLIVGEAAMMNLDNFISRQNAHDVVYERCKKTVGKGSTLFDALRQDERVTKVIPARELQRLCDSMQYLGSVEEMVDDTLAVSKAPSYKPRLSKQDS
jgi:3-carboxy-cis,cis-muconate cycloisomerase